MVAILHQLFLKVELTKLGSPNAPAIKDRPNKDFLYSAPFKKINLFKMSYRQNTLFEYYQTEKMPKPIEVFFQNLNE